MIRRSPLTPLTAVVVLLLSLPGCAERSKTEGSPGPTQPAPPPPPVTPAAKGPSAAQGGVQNPAVQGVGPIPRSDLPSLIGVPAVAPSASTSK